MGGRLAAGAMLAGVLLESCVKYQPHALNPVQSQEQFEARSLDIPALAEFARKPLDLDALTRIGIYFSPELEVARASAAAAAAALITARQRVNPSLSAEGGYNKTPESASTYSVSPAFTIETAGKRGYRILEAEKRAEASRIALFEAEWQVRSGIRTAALADYMAASRDTLLQLESAARDEVVNILAKRVSAGESAAPELNGARAEQAALAAELRSADGALEQSFAAVAAAVGVPVEALKKHTIDLSTLGGLPPPEDLPLLKVEQRGLLHRADIRRTLVEYEAEDARLRLEVANQYPNVSLNPAYAFQEGFPAYTLGSVLESLPLFHHHEGQIAEAEAGRRVVETRFLALQAQIIGQTEVALRQYESAFGVWRDIRDTVEPLQRQREEAVAAGLKAGENDRLDVVRSRLATLAASRTRLDGLERAQTALGVLEDEVQSSLSEGRQK